MLGFRILYFKGMRLIMFQLSGFHCRWFRVFNSSGLELQWSRVQNLSLRVLGA